MLISLHTTTARPCCSRIRILTRCSPSPTTPITTIRFLTDYREKLSYLRHLGLVDLNPRSPDVPSHQCLDQILVMINYLKSKGFTESDVQKIAYKCPKLFLSGIEPADIEPVFIFLASDVSATAAESCGIVVCCPKILLSNVEFCLRPTFAFLKDIGLKKLNSPSALNAHLLNARVSNLEAKVEFLNSIGFTREESIKACVRLPAIFGYSIENNLKPKVEFLIQGMQRSIDELKEFPQYFAFSLSRRIVPRYMHLKQRDINISLKRMLMPCDNSFFAKWRQSPSRAISIQLRDR